MSQTEQPKLAGMALTLPEYLEAAEGSIWTREDTVWVRAHIREVERVAEDIVRRVKGKA